MKGHKKRVKKMRKRIKKTRWVQHHHINIVCYQPWWRSIIRNISLFKSEFTCFWYFTSYLKDQLEWIKCVKIETGKANSCQVFSPTSNCCISCTIESPTNSTSGSASLHSCTNLVCCKKNKRFQDADHNCKG